MEVPPEDDDIIEISPRHVEDDLTNIEKEIHSQLSKDDQVLYRLLRKTKTNARIMLAIARYQMLQLNYPKDKNMVEPFFGQIRMRDIMIIDRDLNDEKLDVQTLPQEAFLYILGFIVERQHFVGKEHTCVFPLNVCRIDDAGIGFRDYEMLDRTFADFITQSHAEDIFKKKYLVFPIRWHGRYYCTLVANPLSGIKGGPKESKELPRNRTPMMIHYGSSEMPEYAERFGPHIFQFMEKFVELYGPAVRYQTVLQDRFEVVNKELPEMATGDLPFQSLYVIDQLVKLFAIERTAEEINAGLQKIGENHEEIITEMATLRDQIGHDIKVRVLGGDDKAAKQLYEQRMEIRSHQEEMREEQKKKQEQREKEAKELARLRKIKEEERYGEPSPKMKRMNDEDEDDKKDVKKVLKEETKEEMIE